MVFDHVDFGYTEERRFCTILRYMQGRGRRLPLWGATGAGENNGHQSDQPLFYDVQDGKIRYDGININKIQKRRPAAFPPRLVLQDTHLFTRHCHG